MSQSLTVALSERSRLYADRCGANAAAEIVFRWGNAYACHRSSAIRIAAPSLQTMDSVGDGTLLLTLLTRALIGQQTMQGREPARITHAMLRRLEAPSG